ncbi:hypothetical protein SAMN02746066_02225 [Anaerosporobacter mobilis DSM 15930]|uniref:Uncharacterized protein n=1 Tax=Anaerosporobacter mobilis DSM 15930 TaxID=1120996 RepID=A0A1M7JEL8_9FIRM|nr:hypothetical protein SAMN02746066_02225 [Anaerosporobacter mobilis DSM 15930]
MMEKERYFWIDIDTNGNQTDDSSSEDSSEEETSTQGLKS